MPCGGRLKVGATRDTGAQLATGLLRLVAEEVLGEATRQAVGIIRALGARGILAHTETLKQAAVVDDKQTHQDQKANNIRHTNVARHFFVAR